MYISGPSTYDLLIIFCVKILIKRIINIGKFITNNNALIVKKNKLVLKFNYRNTGE